MFLNENAKVEELVLEGAEDATDTEQYYFEAVLENVDALHNLQVAVMKVEHKAYVAEDTALLEGAVGDFWVKAKAAAVAFWNKITGWFKAVLLAVRKAFMGDSKWATESKTDATAINGKPVTAFKYKKIKGLDSAAGIEAFTAGITTKDDLAAFTALDEEVEVTKATNLNKAIANLIASEKEVKILEAQFGVAAAKQNEALVTLGEADKAAYTKALTERDMELGKLRLKITLIKKLNSIDKAYASKCLSNKLKEEVVTVQESVLDQYL